MAYSVAAQRLYNINARHSNLQGFCILEKLDGDIISLGHNYAGMGTLLAVKKTYYAMKLHSGGLYWINYRASAAWGRNTIKFTLLIELPFLQKKPGLVGLCFIENVFSRMIEKSLTLLRLRPTFSLADGCTSFYAVLSFVWVCREVPSVADTRRYCHRLLEHLLSQSKAAGEQQNIQTRWYLKIYCSISSIF